MDAIGSYLFGLFVTDGNLTLNTRNRGRISLEVSEKDKDIIEKLFKLIPNSSISERTRDTNFKLDYHTYNFTNSRREFREWFIKRGFPVTNKTETCGIPSEKYSIFDFWRGVIDGDGSLGITAKGFPFISLVTKSEPLKIAYCDFLKEYYNIDKNVNRNKRDDVYNIVLFREDAQQLIHDLYIKDNPSLYIDRKYNSALKALEWVRPNNMPKKKAAKRYTAEEIEFLKTHSIEECISHFSNRTPKAIRLKKHRLETGNK